MGPEPAFEGGSDDWRHSTYDPATGSILSRRIELTYDS
jgi:hypothetical protein